MISREEYKKDKISEIERNIEIWSKDPRGLNNESVRRKLELYKKDIENLDKGGLDQFLAKDARHLIETLNRFEVDINKVSTAVGRKESIPGIEHVCYTFRLSLQELQDIMQNNNVFNFNNPKTNEGIINEVYVMAGGEGILPTKEEIEEARDKMTKDPSNEEYKKQYEQLLRKAGININDEHTKISMKGAMMSIGDQVSKDDVKEVDTQNEKEELTRNDAETR